MNDLPWHRLTLVQWRDRVAATSATAGLEAALTRIEQRNSAINAFTQLLADQAREDAARLDSLPTHKRGPMHGVPIGIKEEIDVRGAVTTFGTRANVTPKTDDSAIVSRLRRAGAIIIGKTAMPEFGAFPFTESEGWGLTRNPHDLTRTPGGSSGGSAAAVADGMVPCAIGGDGGGSIRIPAAHCGLVGLKTGRGNLPTAPYRDLWCDLGVSGPLTTTVEDAAILYQVLSDSRLDNDHSSPRARSGNVLSAEPHKEDTHAGPEAPTKFRIGVHTRPLNPLVPPAREHIQAVHRVARDLAAAGHEIVPLRLEHRDPTAAFVTQMFAGIREEIAGLEHPDRIERRHKVTRVMGAWATPWVVRWAREWSETLGEELDRELTEVHGVDFLLTPTLSCRPARAGILTGKGAVASQLSSLSSIAFTALWNVSGHAALALPAGRGQDGLPVSVQLIAPRQTERGGAERWGDRGNCEHRLLRLGAAMEAHGVLHGAR